MRRKQQEVDLFLQSELVEAQRQEEVEVGHLDDDCSAEIKLEEGDGSDSITEETEEDEDEPVEQSRSAKVKRRE